MSCKNCEQQKRDWRKSRNVSLFDEASAKAKELGETVAIIKKSGCHFDFLPVSKLTSSENVIGYSGK